MEGAHQREQTECTGLHLRKLVTSPVPHLWQSPPTSYSCSAIEYQICQGAPGARMADSLALASLFSR